MSDETGAPTVPGVQVVIDCADPHAQAEFWAAALGYEVEDVEPSPGACWRPGTRRTPTS